MRYGFSFSLNGNIDNGSETDKKCALHPEYQIDMRHAMWRDTRYNVSIFWWNIYERRAYFDLFCFEKS